MAKITKHRSKKSERTQKREEHSMLMDRKNIIKGSILSKVIYRFNTIPIILAVIITVFMKLEKANAYILLVGE